MWFQPLFITLILDPTNLRRNISDRVGLSYHNNSPPRSRTFLLQAVVPISPAIFKVSVENQPASHLR